MNGDARLRRLTRQLAGGGLWLTGLCGGAAPIAAQANARPAFGCYSGELTFTVETARTVTRPQRASTGSSAPRTPACASNIRTIQYEYDGVLAPKARERKAEARKPLPCVALGLPLYVPGLSFRIHRPLLGLPPCPAGV